MKNTLVICCLIVAALFCSAIQAQSLCEKLAVRAVGGDKTEEAFVVLWVNASFAAYATNPSFGSAFTNASDATWAAHVSYYGSLIGCTTINATTFPPIANDNMTDVHNFTIPAADFEAYVELTRQALQTVVPDAIVAEVTQFYQIFESFHESNSTTKSTICNQPDCQTAETVTINGASPITFSDSYIPLSALSLTVDNPTTEAVDLYFIASTATDCTSAALLQDIQPDELAQTLDLVKLPESGVYYIYQATSATECFLNTTIFNTSVLILDFTLPPAIAPVDVPINAPIEPPVTEPIAPPVTEPIAPPTEAPVEPPINTPVDPPVNPPVDPPTEPVAAPVTIEVPVDAPVAAVPISAPVSDGNITPSTSDPAFQAGGYIAGIVILVLIVIGLLIAVIVMGVRLRRNSTVVVA